MANVVANRTRSVVLSYAEPDGSKDGFHSNAHTHLLLHASKCAAVETGGIDVLEGTYHYNDPV